MTNNQIIFNASQQLAEAGRIGYTGRVFQMATPDGETITVKETEPIHTFQHWKELGYSVRKGEKAVAKLTIWKHTTRKPKADEDGETAEAESKMFMKVSAFFALSQVQPIKKEA